MKTPSGNNQWTSSGIQIHICPTMNMVGDSVVNVNFQWSLKSEVTYKKKTHMKSYLFQLFYCWIIKVWNVFVCLLKVCLSETITLRKHYLPRWTIDFRGVKICNITLSWMKYW